MLPTFKPYAGLAIAVLVSALIAGIGLYIHGAEKAKAQVLVLEERLDKAQGAARTNSESFKACQSVNEANRAEAEKQARNAHEAAKRAAEADEAANHAILTANVEIARLRARGLDCPAIDTDFRDWLRD